MCRVLSRFFDRVGHETDPHTELDNLISTELDNCLICTELDSEISTQLDNCQISTVHIFGRSDGDII